MAARHPAAMATVLELAERFACRAQVAWALLMASAVLPQVGLAAGLDPEIVHSAQLQAYFRAWFFHHPQTAATLQFERRLAVLGGAAAPPGAVVGRATSAWPSPGAAAPAIEQFCRQHATLVIGDGDGTPRCHLALASDEDGVRCACAIRVDQWAPEAVLPNTLELSWLRPGVHADRTSFALRARPGSPCFGRRDEMWPYPPDRPDAIVPLGPSRVEITGDRTYVATFAIPWAELGGPPRGDTELCFEAAVMEPVVLRDHTPQHLLVHPGPRWFAWAAPHRLIWHGLLPREMGVLRFTG
jgi:hypothetical protein